MQHHPGEGAPAPAGSPAGGEAICPPHLISMGNEVKREQPSVPIELFPSPPLSFNVVSETSLLGSGGGRLKPQVNCSVCRSILWRGSPLHGPTCTVLMDLSSPPCRQMRHRNPTGFTSGQAGDVPGGRGKPPARLGHAGRLGFPTRSSSDDPFVLGGFFFFFNLKIHIPTST